METLSDFQGPVEGVFLKIVIDLLRIVFPAIDQRWVHLSAFVGALILSGILHHNSVESFLSNTIVVMLAAIGTNEVARLTMREE